MHLCVIEREEWWYDKMRYGSRMNETKVKGHADIVFVVDVSGSMSDIVEALKMNIANFVETMLDDPQSTVKSYRLGIVAHGVPHTPDKIEKVDFLDSADQFVSELMAVKDGGQEYGVPAIECAADFDWRNVSRRYIVFFSDEPVETGHRPEFQRTYVGELCQKMADLHVHFLGYNTDSCPTYADIGSVPGSSYEVVGREELIGQNMQELLSGAAGSVSTGVDASGVTSPVAKNLYGINY